jgi:hypothetical protein
MDTHLLHDGPEQLRQEPRVSLRIGPGFDQGLGGPEEDVLQSIL